MSRGTGWAVTMIRPSMMMMRSMAVRRAMVVIFRRMRFSVVRHARVLNFSQLNSVELALRRKRESRYSTAPT